MKNFFKNEKTLLFLGGLVSGIAGVHLVKSKTARTACVNVLAKGMKLHNDAQVTLETMKEDAQDIFAESKAASEQE